MPSRQTLQTNSITLSYLEWENQGKPPVLLLHGLADHAGVWQKLGDALAHDYHVVAPDLRGHGDSSKPEQGYGYANISADLTGLMTHLGWTSAHIAGHSWSGRFLCAWAQQQQSLFQSLILVDPAFSGGFPRWTKPFFPLFYKVLPFLKMMGPFETYQAAESQAKDLKQYRDWSEFQQAVFQASIEQKPNGTWGSKFCIAARNEVFNEFTQGPVLKAPIELSTLLVVPDQGLNTRAGQLKPYQQHFKHLKIQTVPGNHWAFLVAPQAFNPAIAKFLQGLQP